MGELFWQERFSPRAFFFAKFFFLFWSLEWLAKIWKEKSEILLLFILLFIFVSLVF